jgi:hypothetical protein
MGSMMCFLQENSVKVKLYHPGFEGKFETCHTMLKQPVKAERIDASQIDSYQLLQMKHDEIYHPDILSLGVPRRMNHVTLHLVKYLGALCSSSVPLLEKKRAFVDSFIMVVSASNLLGIPLSRCLNGEKLECATNGFISSYINVLSKLAKACEATDHQEDYPIRAVWDGSVRELFRLLICESEDYGVNLLDDCSQRLASVEGNHPLNHILKEKA